MAGAAYSPKRPRGLAGSCKDKRSGEDRNSIAVTTPGPAHSAMPTIDEIENQNGETKERTNG